MAVKLLSTLLAILVSLAALGAQTVEHSKRLVLKNGDYQLATKWEVKGDRVRYFSAERYGWEEVPYSMVDWPATEKYQKDAATGEAAESKSLTAEEEAERKAEDARSPIVAPGI